MNMIKQGQKKIVVAANFTVELIGSTLESLLKEWSMGFELEVAPYNQIFQQLLDSGSFFRTNQSGVNIIYLRLEDLTDSRTLETHEIIGQIDKIKSNAFDLVNHLGNAEQFRVPTFVFLCPQSSKVQGDALKAVSVFVEIEEKFGHPLPLSALIDSPTIEKLAKRIDSGPGANEIKYLVPIRATGSMLPAAMFLIIWSLRMSLTIISPCSGYK